MLTSGWWLEKASGVSDAILSRHIATGVSSRTSLP
ncbi:hypothetical protein M2275_006616 [Rhodococcus opacus]|nr:hypothetical protein [Rhodococcus opacus]